MCINLSSFTILLKAMDIWNLLQDVLQICGQCLKHKQATTTNNSIVLHIKLKGNEDHNEVHRIRNDSIPKSVEKLPVYPSFVYNEIRDWSQRLENPLVECRTASFEFVDFERPLIDHSLTEICRCNCEWYHQLNHCHCTEGNENAYQVGRSWKKLPSDAGRCQGNYRYRCSQLISDVKHFLHDGNYSFLNLEEELKPLHRIHQVPRLLTMFHYHLQQIFIQLGDNDAKNHYHSNRTTNFPLA